MASTAFRSAAAPARDHGRGGATARNADVGARLVAAIEAAEGLAREQQQLKAEVATHAQAADAASARASSQDSAYGPLRSDVRLLQQQLAAQNESLATPQSSGRALAPKTVHQLRP